MIKILKSLRIEHVMSLTLSKSIFSTFFQNELKSIEHNNSFATSRRNVEIIKKKKFENYLKDVIIKKFLKFFDQLNKKFAELLFCCRTKT